MKSHLINPSEKQNSSVDFRYELLSMVAKSFESLRGRIKNVNLNNMGYIPRWCVMSLDILIALASGAITFGFLRSMGSDFFHPAYPISSIALFMFFNILFFRVFEIYSGIIRHSSYADALRIFAAQLLSLGGLLLVDYFFFLEFKQGLFLRAGLVVNTLFTSTALFSYRIFVKYIFEHQRNKILSPRVIPALIIGTSTNAIALAEALKCEITQKYIIMGFVD